MQVGKLCICGVGAVLVAVGVIGGANADTVQSADARFRAIYTREWNWRVKQMLASDGERNTVPDHLPHVDA
ncbi:MAG: hypothetical protein KGO02_18115, partial [Alphaproteobacteria bacterium]|nr:hypothetical protein [Alphaproteobacteria bacterium]